MNILIKGISMPTVEQGLRTINIYADGVVTNYAEETIGKAMPVTTAHAGVRPVVQGQWLDAEGKPVPLDDRGCPRSISWCSECGDWLTGSDEYSVRGYFCPNCGADMREVV